MNRSHNRNRRHSAHDWRAALARRLSPRNWARQHAQVGIESLGRLYRNWLPSLMTAAVIGIALALPAGLYLLLDNIDRLSGSWDGQTSLSVFLEDTISEKQARKLADDIMAWPEVDELQLVTPAAAIKEFEERSGFADVLKALDENPLPVVLIISPAQSHAAPETIPLLKTRLEKLPETALAQLDLQWVQRLHAILDAGRRAILIISALLGLAVLLVIGNTIRLEIQNRREEILVTKLIGATNAFVRRPFLYSGTWYGVLGALLAWGLVMAGFLLLSEPVSHLAGLYHSDFSLQLPTAGWLGVLLGGGILLGLLGSWLAVGRHLDAIEPT